jgi:hypothetical protein
MAEVTAGAAVCDRRRIAGPSVASSTSVKVRLV